MDTNDHTIVASDDPAVEMVKEVERALADHSLKLEEIVDLLARNEIDREEARRRIEEVGQIYRKRLEEIVRERG